jgi:hypothetical protein
MSNTTAFVVPDGDVGEEEDATLDDDVDGNHLQLVPSMTVVGILPIFLTAHSFHLAQPLDWDFSPYSDQRFNKAVLRAG